MFGGRTPIQHVAINGGTDRTSLEILNSIYDNSKPFHPLQGFLNPKIEFLQVKVVCWILMRVLSPLRIKNGKQSVILCQVALDGKAQTLGDLVAVGRSFDVSLEPIIHLFK